MKKIFMAVIALMMTISASAQFYIYYSDGTVAKVDSISIIAPSQGNDNLSNGIGVFSVSGAKKVAFSKGNLQYTLSSNTWSFARTQYEIIGTDNVEGGSAFFDPANGDEKEGNALADKVDLFGWSTATTNFGVSTSIHDDYKGSFVDWGSNTIGNDAPNTWRTLTLEEWDFLIHNRTNANNLVGVAQVNGVNGLVVLPDNWTCPEGVTFKSGFDSGIDVANYATYQTFTAGQWSKLETSGAVFLPAAGARYHVTVYDVQLFGGYWSASELNSSMAYRLYIYPFWAIGDGSNRFVGHSVRLVKDLK